MTIECTFWAVGQGLFSSGKIYDENSNAKPFTWVYDCGSTAPKRDLAPAILAYPEKHIDLLVLSHFDSDHKNGIDKLLKNKTVKYLLLPYYVKWQRLLVAQLEDIDEEDPLFSYYENPLQYIQEHYIEQFIEGGEILLLPPKFDETPITVLRGNPESELNYMELDDSSEEAYWEIREEIRIFEKKYPQIKVKLLNPNKPIVYSNIAEFVPYNMPLAYLSKQNINIDQFKNDVENVLQGSTKLTNNTLNKLTKLFESYFGSSGKNKNMISLFLFVKLFYSPFINTNFPSFKYIEKINTLIKGEPNQGILYCGDAYLDDKQYFYSLYSAMGKERMENIFCLQVAHHGAEANWYPNLANDFHPQLSVFSANPNKSPHHPHMAVLRDFADYNPIITNTKNNVDIIFR